MEETKKEWNERRLREIKEDVRKILERANKRQSKGKPLEKIFEDIGKELARKNKRKKKK